MDDFQNQLFLVTGASSGIGFGTAKKLNTLGAKVIAVGRSEEKLKNLKNSCKYKENLICEIRDLSEISGLDKWVLELSKKYGRLKGGVLCAGMQQIMPISLSKSIEKSKELFEINYFSSMQIAKGFCDRRVNIGEGSSLVFISSIAAIEGNGGIVSYSASKGAISSAVKSLAKEVSKSRIRVNAVLPGFLQTPMTKSLSNVYTNEYIKRLENEYPLGIGSVEDVVNPIIFLLSSYARWITGENLVVDGGASA